MIRILCEPSFCHGVWGKKICDGLIEELKKRRLVFKKEMSAYSAFAGDTVYIIASSHVLINNLVYSCNEKDIVPVVLCTQSNHLMRGRYNCVCTDTVSSMQQLLYASNTGDFSKIALYGVNNNSIADVSRAKIFTDITSGVSDVYINNGSLSECFKNFLPHVDEYDTVICVNSYAAITLVTKLREKYPEKLSHLKIICYSLGKLSSFFSKYITSINLNFEQYGKAALSVSELSSKNPYISSLTATIKWEFDSPDARIPPAAKNSNIAKSDNFYEDNEVKRLLTVEKLLDACDDTDIKILQLLVQGETYESIAESCFFSKESVKYHVKKYVSICGTSSRTELIELVKDLYPFTESLF